nr:hypothetical protein [Tanacetum cinerariifolium]
DQAIQTILLGLPEDITDHTTAMNIALALMAKAFKLNYSTPTNNNQRISSNPRNRKIAQLGMNMGQYRQMQMVRGNGENHFRQYAGQNIRNLNGFNDVQKVGNQAVAQLGMNMGQDRQMQMVGANGGNQFRQQMQMVGGNGGNQFRQYAGQDAGNPAGYNDVIGNQAKEKGCCLSSDTVIDCSEEEARIQLQAKEYDLMAAAADLDEIEKVNAN